jgi:hypothetical protein
VGDGALGFWAAVRDVWPKTRTQRDWVHYADQGIMPSATRGALWDKDVALMCSA